MKDRGKRDRQRETKRKSETERAHTIVDEVYYYCFHVPLADL